MAEPGLYDFQLGDPSHAAVWVRGVNVSADGKNAVTFWLRPWETE